MFQYLMDNLLPIGMAIAGVVAWIFDKRKRDAEVQNMDTQNIKAKADVLNEIKEAYDGFAVEIRQQLATMKKENDRLNDVVSSMRRENEGLKRSVAFLEQELSVSMKEREQLKAQIDSFTTQSERDTKLIAKLQSKIESYEVEIKAFRKERL